MKTKLKCLALFIFFVLTIFSVAYASTSDKIANQYYLELYGSFFPDLNSPYTITEGEGIVNESTGALCTNEVDYCFKGKNDFDISVVRSYNTMTTEGDIDESDLSSKKSNEQYFYMVYVCSADNDTVYIKFNNEAEMAEADPSFEGKMYKQTRDEFWYSDLKESGTGIFYTLKDPSAEPSIEMKDTYTRHKLCSISTDDAFINLNSGMRISVPGLVIYDILGDEETDEVYLFFQDIRGQTQSLSLEYDIESWPYKFIRCQATEGVSYNQYEVHFVNTGDVTETAIHPRGFEYSFTLVGDNGDTYFIKRINNDTYRILYAQDRYGNGYLINTDDGHTFVDDNGVAYDITKTGITKTSNGVVTQLVSYTEEKINSESDTYDKYNIDDEYIFTVTKNSGNSDEISEDEDTVTKYYIKRGIKYEYILRYGKLAAYNLPYKIELPSGLTKHIEYTAVDWEVSDVYSDSLLYGLYYPVSRYYEEDLQGDIRNESTFEYTVSESSSSKRTYISSTEREELSDGIRNKYIISEMDKHGRLSSQKVKKNAYNYETYTYDYINTNSDARISDVEERYVSDSVSAAYTKDYAYLNEHYLRNETIGDYEVNYTYHEDGNYIPHETTYMKDAETEIRIENFLTEDKKGIATQNTYENDVLVKTVSYTYDSYGNISSEIADIDSEEAMRTYYTYTYASDGGYTLVTRIQEAQATGGTRMADIVTTSVFDSRHNLISYTDANGNTTTTTYDMLNRPLTVTYPDGTTQSYTYDIANGITTYTAPNGTVYKAYFDAWGNKVKTTAVIDGEEIQFDEYTYDDIGNIVTYKVFSSDTDFVKAEYTYDYLNRPTSEKIYDEDDTLIKTTTYTYTLAKDADNRPLNTVTATETGDGGMYASVSETKNYRGFTTETKTVADVNERAYTYTHDYVGNVLTAADPVGNVTTTTYNAFGKPLSVTYADGSAVSTTYNMLGLATEVTDARGNTTHYYYDNAGRNVCVESPIDDYNTARTVYGYDPNGNVTYTSVLTNIEPLAENYRTVYNRYDNMNRLSSVNTGVAYIRYYYDNMGNLTKTSEYTEIYADEDDGIDTTYIYDALGRMICTTTPDGLTETADYDYLGRVTSSTDKAGRVTSLSYDSFNNLLSKSIGEESVSYTYNLLGLPTSMTDSTGTTSYAYSPFGELTTETKGDIIKSYTYDDLSRRTAFNVADGEDDILSQTYTYDVMGRLIDTSSGADTVSYTYDANSNLLTKAHNGNVYHTAQYNKANMPVVTQLYNDRAVADTTHYAYNLDGNLAMTVGSKVSSQYYYDYGNRLVHESTWGDGIDYSDDYDYDFRGNRTKRVHKDKITNSTETTDYTYNIINQLTSQTNGTDTVNYNYDTVGNMTSVSKNGTTEKAYTYDPFNRLATANVNGTTSSYTYNGDNLRQTKTVNGVTTSHIYDGANIVADQSTDTTVFVRGMGLALLKNGTTTQVYGITPRGDVSQLMTPNGTITDFTYTAYGEPTTPNTSIYNPFGYTGEYTDAETGLVYLRNRYYDPEIGIFITIDPAKDGFNWYEYCNGNPVNFVDPWGLYILEYGEDGKVYATIESGDTLSGIAYNEVGDANAYVNINYESNPSVIDVGQKIEITDIYSNSNPQPNILLSSNHSNIPPASSGYVSPKNGHKWDRSKKGWLDKDGNVWIPDKSGHGGKHWDVQYPNGGYDNVYEDGRVRAGKGKRGKFSPKNETNKKENEKITTENQSESKVNVAGEDVAIAVVGTCIVYQGVKWIAAFALSGYTGGGSLIGAGMIP